MITIGDLVGLFFIVSMKFRSIHVNHVHTFSIPLHSLTIMQCIQLVYVMQLP